MPRMPRLPHVPIPLVGEAEPPNREDRLRVGDRWLGWAEFGEPDGHLVLWCHGTPGARRQIPQVGREAARRLGLRIVCVERPGVGLSTGHKYRRIVEFADDAGRLATELGHDRFAVVGLSGGGPYALAVAAELPERVVAVGVLGGVCPVAGHDAATSAGVVGLAARFNRLLEPVRVPMGLAIWAAVQPLTPLAHFAYNAYSRISPPGDRVVMADPGIEAMFIDDLLHGAAFQFGAVAHDAALFGRHWGFRLRDVQAPVRWWHGDSDHLVPFDQAEQACALLPDCELHLRPGEGHLGGFAAADEVLEALAPYFDGARV